MDHLKAYLKSFKNSKKDYTLQGLMPPEHIHLGDKTFNSFYGAFNPENATISQKINIGLKFTPALEAELTPGQSRTVSFFILKDRENLPLQNFANFPSITSGTVIESEKNSISESIYERFAKNDILKTSPNEFKILTWKREGSYGFYPFTRKYYWLKTLEYYSENSYGFEEEHKGVTYTDIRTGNPLTPNRFEDMVEISADINEYVDGIQGLIVNKNSHLFNLKVGIDTDFLRHKSLTEFTHNIILPDDTNTHLKHFINIINPDLQHLLTNFAVDKKINFTEPNKIYIGLEFVDFKRVTEGEEIKPSQIKSVIAALKDRTTALKNAAEKARNHLRNVLTLFLKKKNTLNLATASGAKENMRDAFIALHTSNSYCDVVKAQIAQQDGTLRDQDLEVSGTDNSFLKKCIRKYTTEREKWTEVVKVASRTLSNYEKQYDNSPRNVDRDTEFIFDVSSIQAGVPNIPTHDEERPWIDPKTFKGGAEYGSNTQLKNANSITDRTFRTLPQTCQNLEDTIFPNITEVMDLLPDKELFKFIKFDTTFQPMNCNTQDDPCRWDLVSSNAAALLKRIFKENRETITKIERLASAKNTLIETDADKEDKLKQLFNFKPINACLHAISKHYPVEFINKASDYLKKQIRKTRSGTRAISGSATATDQPSYPSPPSRGACMHKDLQIVKNFWKKQELKNFKEKQKCMAAVFLTANVRWFDTDEDESKFMAKGPMVRSFDGQFVCKDEENEAQDYYGCANTITQYNAAKALETATIQGSRVYVEAKKNEALADLDPNDPLAMLELQKKVLKESSNVANVKAVTKITLAGIIGGYASSNSRKSDFLGFCYNNMKYSGESFRTDENNNPIEVTASSPKPLTAKSACDLAATKLKLTPNEAMVSKAQEYAAANLIGAAGAFAEGGIQDSAANKLQNAINKLRDQMNEGSEDNQQFFEADTQVSPCLENPNLEECGGKVSLSGNQAAINTGVNVDGGGRGIGTPTSLTADLPDEANAKRIDSNDLGDSDANDRIAAVNSPNARNNKLESSLRGVGPKTRALSGGGGGGGGGGAAPGIGGGGGGNQAPGLGGGDGYRRVERERSENSNFRFGGGNNAVGNNSGKNRGSPFRGTCAKRRWNR